VSEIALPGAKRGLHRLWNDDLQRIDAAVAELVRVLGVSRLDDDTQRKSDLLYAADLFAQRAGDHQRDRRFTVTMPALTQAARIGLLADQILRC